MKKKRTPHNTQPGSIPCWMASLRFAVSTEMELLPGVVESLVLHALVVSNLMRAWVK